MNKKKCVTSNTLQEVVRQRREVTLEYWELTHSDLPMGLYGMDERRVECHDRLCVQYGLDKNVTKQVTDNLDKFQDVNAVHEALQTLTNARIDRQEETR